MDFDQADGAIWPMRVQEGGNFYGFCPAKATWDQETVHVHSLLLLAYETKQLLFPGGIANQPGWFIDLLSWFVPIYDHYKFFSRAKAILGDSSRGQGSGYNSRRTASQNRGRVPKGPKGA